MRILFVIHQFLPRHLAGSELYTYHLAKELQRRGHEVTIFYTEIEPERPQYEMSQGEYDGLPYFEAVHNRSFPSFEHTYRDREMESLFRRVLDAVRPDIVHLQHLQMHSIGYIEVAKRRGLPVLYTLHEYMLMCLREGQLLRPDFTRCPGPDESECVRCATTPPHQRKPAHVGLRVQGVLLRLSRHPRLLRLARRVWRVANPMVGPGDTAYRRAVTERLRTIQVALDRVDLFLAPSRFLRQRFIDSGLIAEEQIEYSRYGMHAAAFSRVEHVPSRNFRVGFVGTIARYKGVHLLVEAFRGIEATGIECKIYGDPDTFPDFRAELSRRGLPPGVRLMGRIETSDLPDALASIDLLVVPSIWYENAPLTIQEAQLAGVPVLTSDCGGMAELVEHEETGLLFRTGDAADLRRRIERCARDPGLMERLCRARPAVRSLSDDAEVMEERYRALCGT